MSTKLTNSEACVFSTSFMSYKPTYTHQDKISPLMAPTCSEKEAVQLQIQVSKCLLFNSDKRFVVCHKWRSVAKQDNFV